MNVQESFKFFLPETFLLVGFFFVIIADLFLKNKRTAGVLALTVLAATAYLAKAPSVAQPLFFGFFTLDAFTHYFRLLALGVTFVTILLSLGYKRIEHGIQGEYYSLLLFLAFALILVAAATNLLMIFMAVEFVSITSYLLVGFLKKDPRSKEAALKYFLFGSLSSGAMLYGMSLLYGLSGSIELTVIQEVLKNELTYHPAALISLLFFFMGLGFKISMAPFHMWAPDVYEAAPTPISGFLTVAPKALGFAVFLRILATAFTALGYKWQILLMAFSILTMTIGNLMAISQTNVKRLLAYSSIAQAGYILMGVTVFNEIGLSGVLIYLLAYAFTNIGAFAVVTAVSNDTDSDELQSYAGLSKRSPFLAAAMVLFLISLAGLPPFAGFIGKFYMFSAAIQEKFYVLAVAAALNSAVAAFYYFKIVRMMYLVPAMQEGKVAPSPIFVVTLSVLIAGIIIIGVYPAPVLAFVKGMLLV